MALAAYTFSLKSVNKSITADPDVLRKIMHSLAVKELFISGFSGTGHLFIYSDKSLPDTSRIVNDLNYFLGIKIGHKSGPEILNEQNAVSHFLKYANGINGENQPGLIRAFAEDLNRAKKATTIGPVFQWLFQRSIWLHEKVRMNTNYFNYSTDTVKIFCELAEKIFDSLSRIVVQIDGFENRIIEFVKNLFQYGCRKFIFDGSDADRIKLANALHFSNLILKGNGSLAFETDVLISVKNISSLISEDQLLKHMAEKNNAPFLLLNINEHHQPQSIPHKLYNVYSYDTLDLEHIVRKNKDNRSKILKEIEPWINQEIDDFYRRLSGSERFHFINIIGQSAKMQEIFELISRISQTDISVLIRGDSGTGKELVSRAIHNLSNRADKPFMVVNCGAIPDNLLESELFGHVRGSFTGAVSNKNGLLYEANNGTILLDEIGELPQQLQVKLLRFLQEGDLKPVGSNATIKVNVRVLAATNKNLQEMVKQGSFRSDLYYRLNVILLELPPLSERREDIPLLADFFLRRYAQKINKDVREISPEAMDHLLAYNWPGNIRELENTIEHAIALSLGKQILPYDLPDAIKNSSLTKHRSTSLTDTQNGVKKLKDIEKLHITRILEETSWDYDKTCTVLGIGRTTLWRKIKEYEIKQ